VQLLYAAQPHIRFAPLLGHLCEVLGRSLDLTVRLSGIADDTATMELGDHRLLVRLDRAPPGAAATCLTFGIGPQPCTPDQGPGVMIPLSTSLSMPLMMARQTDIARKLTEAVTRRMPADQVLWHIAPLALTTALIDDLTARLPQTLPQTSSRTSSQAGLDAAAADDRVDLLRVMEQVQITLGAKSTPRPRLSQAGQRPKGSGRVITGAPLWLTATILAPAPVPALACGPAFGPALGPVLGRILPIPANDTPALPRPDAAGRLRIHHALEGSRIGSKTRDLTRLILTMSRSAARVEAWVARAC
jgi:hypothetical protein